MEKCKKYLSLEIGIEFKAFLLYKVKRDIDTKMLNKDMEDFKKKMRRKSDETRADH